LLIGHPLDTVKARLQTVSTYGGMVDCLRKTIRHESVSRFHQFYLPNAYSHCSLYP
uniref:Solute carrier family 25 member 27 n=1 Tax=Anisakis simplex TaxID=6269 RepID=A0A0M3JLN3_ANISI